MLLCRKNISLLRWTIRDASNMTSDDGGCASTVLRKKHCVHVHRIISLGEI